jgi:hypothetical protein
MTTTDRGFCDFLKNQRKAHPDPSSVSEVEIYYNNQNTIAIVAIQPNGVLGWSYLLHSRIEGFHFIYCQQ